MGRNELKNKTSCWFALLGIQSCEDCPDCPSEEYLQPKKKTAMAIVAQKKAAWFVSCVMLSMDAFQIFWNVSGLELPTLGSRETKCPDHDITAKTWEMTVPSRLHTVTIDSVKSYITISWWFKAFPKILANEVSLPKRGCFQTSRYDLAPLKDEGAHDVIEIDRGSIVDIQVLEHLLQLPELYKGFNKLLLLDVTWRPSSPSASATPTRLLIPRRC